MVDQLQIEKLEGRKGEEQEFVEFRIEQAGRSFIAQESGKWWLVFDNCHGPQAPVKTIYSFPPGGKAKNKAVAAARAAAKAFVAAHTLATVSSA